MSGIVNFPFDSPPKEDSLRFFLITRQGWQGGRKQRVRMSVKRARQIVALENTVVEYDDDQDFPPVGTVSSGSQKALVYGKRGKSDKKKDQLKLF